MLVTDIGRLIRVPADQVRITGRQAMGVTLFRVDSGEHVTSVFPVLEEESDDSEPPGEAGPVAASGDGEATGGDTSPPNDPGPDDAGPDGSGPDDAGPDSSDPDGPGPDNPSNDSSSEDDDNG
jgi:DNA gyrase subunit A